LHGNDYFTNGSGLAIERKFGKGKNLVVDFIELQNVELYPKGYSMDGIVYHRRHYSQFVFIQSFLKRHGNI